MNNLLGEISELIRSARTVVLQSVDLMQVLTNFEIGRRIVEVEQEGEERAEYGKTLLPQLSEELTREFGRGFSRTNLEYMRKFYLAYKERSPNVRALLTGHLQSRISQKPSGKLSLPQISQKRSGKSSIPFSLGWSHYILLISIDNIEERSFYELESTENGWTLAELKRQFNAGLYERLALSREKERVADLAQTGQIIKDPSDLLKEPYILEFLGLDQRSNYSESDLESAIIDKLEHFLLELGKGFLFEARQKRFTFGEDHFFVDLVFYNRLLRCYVLIDLKLGKVSHGDLGQMQMYVNYFDRFVKLEQENPTVGIVLCKKKHDALVEITLPQGSNIHAKEYQLYLPDKKVLKKKLEQWLEEREEGNYPD